MYPHRIRLRGPWECEPLARFLSGAGGDLQLSTESLPPRFQITMPRRWHEGGLANFAGRVRFRRRFSWPARIDPHERVWLTFAGVTTSAKVWLNDHLLGQHQGPPDPFEFDVTQLLQLRNHLTVEVESTTTAGGLWGEVALEVRATAYLRGIRWWTTREGTGARLNVAGEVVGTADGTLELYALMNNKTVIYSPVETSPEGKPFELSEESPATILNPDDTEPGPTRQVRVELVRGGTVWYTVEGPLES
jgi:hypothetical protein